MTTEAFFLAFTSAVIYGVSDFLGGLASRKISAIAVVTVMQPVSLAALLVVFPFLPGQMHFVDLLWSGASGLAFVVGIVLFYLALARSSMAIISPVAAIVGASVPVIFGHLLGERTSLLADIGILLGCAAIALTSAASEKGKPIVQDPGLKTALWSGLSFGVSLSLLAHSGHDAGLWPLLAAQITSTLAIWGWTALHPVPLRLDRSTLFLIVFTGVLTTIASAFYVLAAHVGLLSIVAVLSSLYPVVTVILAYVILKERLSIRQWMGILCALSGMGFIALGS